MPTDIQFKDELRKDLITYKRYKDLLSANRLEELENEFNANIERIEKGLED